MTIREVVDYLKLPKRTIYWLAGAKQIAAFKVSRGCRFSKADSDEWGKRQSHDDYVLDRDGYA